MKTQSGHATVEFALAGSMFLVLLFGVFETGRLFFLWNTLHEATRRGARMAAVCPLNHPAIARSALFTDNNNNNQSVLPDMTAADFKLEYLDATGNVLSQPDNAYASIKFVRFAVRSGKTVTTLIPGVSVVLTLPDFSTVLPVESLGLSRDNASPQCQGESA